MLFVPIDNWDELLLIEIQVIVNLWMQGQAG